MVFTHPNIDEKGMRGNHLKDLKRKYYSKWEIFENSMVSLKFESEQFPQIPIPNISFFYFDLKKGSFNKLCENISSEQIVRN